MNTKSERGNAVIIVVIVLALIIAAGMYLQARNGADVVTHTWDVAGHVIDTLSTQQGTCYVTTYANGSTSTTCQ